MSSARDDMLDALKASMAAAMADRVVERGLKDPAALNAEEMRRGHFAIVASAMGEWLRYRGREAESGKLKFAVVFHGQPSAKATALDVERMEGEALEQLLAWCREARPEPLDTVFPIDATFSRGLDAPVAWMVVEMEANYV